jgi:hypothetical protein
MLLASSSGAGTSTKFYSVGLTPNPVDAGSTFTVSITNCGATSPAPCTASTVSNQTLAAANVTFTGFTPVVSGAVSVTTASGTPSSKVWTASVSGNTLQLRSVDVLAPGEKVSVGVTAPTLVGTYATSSDARQSNNFSGPPGNRFVNADGDPALVVIPAALHHFVFDPIPASGGSNPVAGVAYAVGVSAYDRFNNLKTNYVGPGTPSGNLNTTPVGCGGTCTPSYSIGTWSGGHATFTFTPYKAESGRHVTLTDGSVSSNSNDFTVDPNVPFTLTFVKQPTQSAVGAVINATTTPAGVQVQAQDRYANLVPGAAVAMAIGNNPGGAALSGTTPRTTNSSGVATFLDLSINQVGVGYTLVATSGSASRSSKAFIVGDAVNACTTTCQGSSNKNGSHVTANASGTTSDETIGLALIPSSAPPSGVCPGFTPGPGVVGTYVNLTPSGSSTTPSVTVNWLIDQAVVTLFSNNGAGKYNICLGAVNTNDPQGTGSGFPTKGGGTATPVFDPVFGVAFFYGLLPDCSGNGTPVNPCILSANKLQNGDVSIVYVVPYPWIGSFDPAGWAG